MATKKNDERKAIKRYYDQKGQWINTTPASVKKKQAQAWSDLAASMKKTKKREKK